MDDKYKTVSRIREFNRFYTVFLGILDKTYIEDFPLIEARMLYELLANPGCTASYLSSKLQADKSYISRNLKHFEAKGWLTKKTSEEDNRYYRIYLTPEGSKEASHLITVTNNDLLRIIDPLSEEECEEICEAMDTITRYFGGLK